MNEEITYQKVEQLQYYEFGFLKTGSEVEVIAINHLSSHIRTIGYCHYIEDAECILETCIRFGFKEKGMTFTGLPNYELTREQVAVNV